MIGRPARAMRPLVFQRRGEEVGRIIIGNRDPARAAEPPVSAGARTAADTLRVRPRDIDIVDPAGGFERQRRRGVTGRRRQDLDRLDWNTASNRYPADNRQLAHDQRRAHAAGNQRGREQQNDSFHPTLRRQSAGGATGTLDFRARRSRRKSAAPVSCTKTANSTTPATTTARSPNARTAVAVSSSHDATRSMP